MLRITQQQMDLLAKPGLARTVLDIVEALGNHFDPQEKVPSAIRWHALSSANRMRFVQQIVQLGLS